MSEPLSAEEEALLTEDALLGESWLEPLELDDGAPPPADADVLAMAREDVLVRERTARALALLREDRAEMHALLQTQDLEVWRDARASRLERELADAAIHAAALAEAPDSGGSPTLTRAALEVAAATELCRDDGSGSDEPASDAPASPGV